MFNILKFLLAIIGVSFLAEVSFGQGDAPAILKGLNQADKSIGAFIRTPNGQVTKISSSSALIETGNNNILENPNFEHSVYDTSWIIGSGTSSKVDVNIDNTKVFSGLNALKMTMAASSLNVFNVSPTGNQAFKDGVQGLVSVRVKTTVSGIKVCQRKGFAVTTNCVNVNPDGKWGLYKVPSILGEFYNGVEVTSTPTAVTGDVYIDDAFVGAVDLKQDVNNIGQWTSFTPTGSWISGTSTYTGRYRQVGDSYEYQVNIAQSGAPTSATLTINLPSGHVIDTQKLAPASTDNITLGTVNIVDSSPVANYISGSVRYNNTTSVQPLSINTTTIYASSINQSGPMVFSSGDSISMKFTVPILGLSGATSVYTASCGANCVDDFSVLVTDGASTTTLSNTNSTFLSGVCTNPSTGSYVCPLVASLFSIAPNCSAQPSGFAGRVPKVETTTSNVTVTISNDAGAVADSNFFLFCDKTGADFVANRTIVGSFAEVDVTPGVTKPKTCHYAFGQTGSTSSSPIIFSSGTALELNDNCATVSPPTFNATGIYTDLTIAAGTFANSSSVSCACEAFHTTTLNVMDCQMVFATGDNTWTASSSGGYVGNIFTSDQAGTAKNSYVSVTCKGQAP